ncbi:CAP domain-containing protein [Baekduia soli]|uniref:CAP domain-containing protein n=1 Tax=Baekduia soli TaxID=496014 RepID=A0A5B8U2A3_9ACTN|nr:CAP domain-containing protein [Baekduia soli]QEC46985.1 CAP domain-containing protein [Baekduia soli]
MPVTAPPPTAVAAATPVDSAIVRAINRVRRTHGLCSVRFNPGLAGVARAHSVDMLRHNVLSHASFNGSSFTARLSRAGRHRRYGETLAWAPNGAGVTPSVLVQLWMNSAPHRAVLMDGRLRRIGVGSAVGMMGAQAGAAITADWSS